MGILSKFFGHADETVKRLSGRTDVLEAGGAVVALVAAADGNIEDEEIGVALDVLKSHDLLSKAFTGPEIEAAVEKQLKRAKTYTGRNTLFSDLVDIAKADEQTCSTVFLIGFDVAYADGTLQPAEKAVLLKVASKLGVDAKSLTDGVVS